MVRRDCCFMFLGLPLTFSLRTWNPSIAVAALPISESRRWSRIESFSSGFMLSSTSPTFSVGQSEIVRGANESASSRNAEELLGGHGENRGPSNLPEGTSWRLLLERSMACSRKIRGSNFVQLATVDSETGAPKCRCVVFRGFVPLPAGHPLRSTCDDLPCGMKMITDLRSQKVSQIARESSSELVWWFPKTSEQYRFAGRTVVVGSETAATKDELPFSSDRTLALARKEMWNNVSDAARESFLSPLVPGDPWNDKDGGGTPSVPPGGRDPDGKLLPPPDNFLLLLLVPSKVDYLRLTNMYRQIDQQDDLGSWSNLRVNP